MKSDETKLTSGARDIRRAPHVYLMLFGTAIALSALALTFAPEMQHKDYNVIIVAFDGLQAKHLKAYGYERDMTPNLDKFFEKSYLFTNTVSPASWTVPAFMSIFTSLYPSEHKLTNKLVEVTSATSTTLADANIDSLRPGTVRLAEILKENGYVTAAFTGDAGVSAKYGYNKGFDFYYETPPFGGFSETEKRAEEWLENHKDSRFLLFLHGYDVHGQHDIEGGLDFRFVDKPYTGPFNGSAQQQRNLRERGLSGENIVLSAESVAFWNAIYDEKIARADEKFGLFMKRVRELGLMENSIIIVLSDHGTEVFDHKRFDHGHTLYSELLNVLFSIHMPGQIDGKEISSLVSTLDLTPTILGLLGITHEAQKDMKGIDLYPSFEGIDVSRPIFSETDYRLYTHKRSITRPDGWKLILTRETGNKELYNLKTDPRELINLSDAEPSHSKELEEELERHFISIGDTGPWPIGCLAVYGDQCKDAHVR